MVNSLKLPHALTIEFISQIMAYSKYRKFYDGNSKQLSYKKKHNDKLMVIVLSYINHSDPN